MAVFHERMAHEAQLGLAARPLAIEPGVEIGGALMAVVGAALAVEVALAVAPRRWRIARALLRAEALHRRPRLDQRAVDAEVLRRQQALDPRVGEHGGEKLVRHIAREQPVTVPNVV